MKVIAIASLVLVLSAVSIAAVRVYLVRHWHSAAFDGYNYATWSELRKSRRPSQGAEELIPGQAMPSDLTIFDLAGKPIQLSSLWNYHPLVLEFGSYTCPIYQGGTTTMDELARKYEGSATVALLYVREAHPGSLRSEQHSFAEKLERAQSLRSSGLQRPIYVDALDGDIHRRFGGYPNGVVVIGRDGVVAHRATWNVTADVEKTLTALASVNGLAVSLPAFHYQTNGMPEHLSKSDQIRYMALITKVGGPDALLDFLF